VFTDTVILREVSAVGPNHVAGSANIHAMYNQCQTFVTEEVRLPMCDVLQIR